MDGEMNASMMSWYGHMKRMDEERVVKSVFESK